MSSNGNGNGKRPKRSPLHELNARQKVFLHGYMTNGGNALGAARAAGYSGNAAGAALLKRERVRAALEYAMERAGLTEGPLVDKIKSLVNAQNPYWNRARHDWDHFPDNPIQLKATQVALKLRGHDTMIEGGGGGYQDHRSVTLVNLTSEMEKLDESVRERIVHAVQASLAG